MYFLAIVFTQTAICNIRLINGIGWFRWFRYLCTSVCTVHHFWTTDIYRRSRSELIKRKFKLFYLNFSHSHHTADSFLCSIIRLFVFLYQNRLFISNIKLELLISIKLYAYMDPSGVYSRPSRDSHTPIEC